MHDRTTGNRATCETKGHKSSASVENAYSPELRDYRKAVTS